MSMYNTMEFWGPKKMRISGIDAYGRDGVLVFFWLVLVVLGRPKGTYPPWTMVTTGFFRPVAGEHLVLLSFSIPLCWELVLVSWAGKARQ